MERLIAKSKATLSNDCMVLRVPLLISVCIFPSCLPDHNPYPSLLFLTIIKTSVCFEWSGECVFMLPSAAEPLPAGNTGLLSGTRPGDKLPD